MSATLFCRFRVRASQAIVERTFVKSSLTKSCVPLSLRVFRMTSTFVLCVVKRTMMSRGVSFSGFFRPIRCDRTTSWVDSCTSSLRAAMSLTRPSVFSFRASGIPRIRTVRSTAPGRRSFPLAQSPSPLSRGSRRPFSLLFRRKTWSVSLLAHGAFEPKTHSSLGRQCLAR